MSVAAVGAAPSSDFIDVDVSQELSAPDRPSNRSLFLVPPLDDVDDIDVVMSIAVQVQGEMWIAKGNLMHPVRVQVQDAGDGLLSVVEPTTGVFGVGSTPSVAISDFRSALVEHRAVLQSAGPLSPDLSEQLAFLNRHLRAE